MTDSVLMLPTEIAGVLTTAITSWWDDVNESTQWQDGIFFSLCGAYALVSAVALVQLIRIQMRVPEYGWTTQKVFHLMNFRQWSSCYSVWISHARISCASQGSLLDIIGSSWPPLLLGIHAACTVLGRDISPGKKLTNR